MIKIKIYETNRVNLASAIYYPMSYDVNMSIKEWGRIRAILDGSDKNKYMAGRKVYFTYI